MSVFDYKYERDFNPIPPAEASLPTVTAERFVTVSYTHLTLPTT